METASSKVDDGTRTQCHERGVFFPGWFPRSHCYHPSLPPRRLRMAEELEGLRATILTWPALGGGSISLPYLQEEANGPVPARFRFYGFVNDREFIAACHKRGISVFGVVFTAQGWEVPAELNDDEDEVLSMTEMRGVGTRRWLGLREFGSDRYPKLWPPFRDYFPQGLVNSRGEQVTDLIEECATRDINGEKIHCYWVECPDREHQGYLMDLNNRVWRAYIKEIIRIQVAAGVDGIQFDEISTPLNAMQYGGCFCPECCDGFTSYLRRIGRPEAAEEGFQYDEWLRSQGYDFRQRLRETPLLSDYIRYQKEMVTASFRELSDFVRETAKQEGRDLRISANTYDMDPLYDAVVPHLDVCVPEHRRTDYRQPAWCRYGTAMAEGKPLLVQVNPYGGGTWADVVGEFSEGGGRDRYRVLAYEAAAMGAVLSVPYGSWMGSEILDAAYAPMTVAKEVQTFLAEHEWLYTNESLNVIGIVYDVESCYESSVLKSMAGQQDGTLGEHQRVMRLASAVAEAQEPFDVVVLHDRRLRLNGVGLPDLSRYEVLLVPAGARLGDEEVTRITGALDKGCRIFVAGEDSAVDGGDKDGRFSEGVRQLLRDSRVEVVERSMVGATLAKLPGRECVVTPTPGFGVNLCRTASGGVAVHLVNYRNEDGATTPVRHVVVKLRGGREYAKARLWKPGCAANVHEDVSLEIQDGVHTLYVPRVDVYGVIELVE